MKAGGADGETGCAGKKNGEKDTGGSRDTHGTHAGHAGALGHTDQTANLTTIQTHQKLLPVRDPV